MCVAGLSGLPWVGVASGLTLEVGVVPGGTPRWMVLPHAHGPNVAARLECVVKAPKEVPKGETMALHVGVWVCGRVWRYGAIGHALTPLAATPNLELVTLRLLNHSQLSDGLGQVEVTLQCDYSDDPLGSDALLSVEVVRALRLKEPPPTHRLSVRHRRDRKWWLGVRVGLWVRGSREHQWGSSPVALPVTRDPVVRARASFRLPRERLQHASVLLKLVYATRWGSEDAVGRVQLGPQLYLGCDPDDPTSDDNTAVTLSHWGQALKTTGPASWWHTLQQ